ncbi:MAG: sigma-54-dependent transcriptional regulator [Bryobacteraceae bacterium]
MSDHLPHPAEAGEPEQGRGVVPAPGRVLIVDDELNQRSALARMLAAWGYATETAENGRDALEKLRAVATDAIITDLNMPVMSGMQMLEELQRTGGAPPAIVLTAFGSVEKAVETVRDLGAFWYLEKPVRPKELRAILERAIEQRRLAQRGERLERELSSRGVLGGMVAHSEAMRAIFALLQQAAPTRATILITGETGSGKEVAARAIHELSPRRSKPFLAINCAALPETLIESELFGHEKGAFTGAAERRAGCFELASGGTLLLDEIGEMPAATQGQLLRVLEDRKVRRLGSGKEIDVDVRIIASTNRDLHSAIQRGEFREDLYFRLNVFEVHLPPLRERREDIPAIAEALIRELNRRHECRVTEISADVLELFQRYPWPGNARELRNVLERAVILCGEGTVTARHLSAGFAGLPQEPRAEGGDTLVLRAGVTVEEAERQLILLTLHQTGNNRTRAAEILGLSVKTLFNKLRQYGESA